MEQEKERRVLAFDASCGGCREISHTVGQACDGKLEVLPLTHPEVRQWRAQRFVLTECTFDSEPARGSGLQHSVQELANRARQAFGTDEARALIMTLGPAENSATAMAAPAGTLCACSDQCHDWCEGSSYCKYGGCDFTRACCTFWQWVCNGFCVSQN